MTTIDTNIDSNKEYQLERLFSLQEDYSYIIEFKNELSEEELTNLIINYNCEIKKYNERFMTNLTFLRI